MSSNIDAIRRVFRIRFIEWILARLPKKQDSLVGKIIPGSYLYPCPSIRHITKYGISLELDISDYLQHYVYFNYIDTSLEVLCSLAEQNMVVYDIGANMGYFSLRLAQKVGVNGKVYSFEPDAQNYKKAEYHSSMLNTWCNNLQIKNIGFGDKKGHYKLYAIDEKNKGMHQVHDEVLDKEFTVINIEVLDEYIMEEKLSPPELIKIDTEGYEMKILRGAAKTITKFMPVLFIEVDDSNLESQNSSAEELIEWLYKLKYTITYAENNKLVSVTDNFKNCHFDIVCRKDSSKPPAGLNSVSVS